MKLLGAIGLIGLSLTAEAQAQQWFSPTAIALDSLTLGDMAWGDYDLDGDQDLLVMGVDPDNDQHTILYENNAGTFSPVSASFLSAQNGTVDFMDFDNDNDLDVLVSGTTAGGPQTATYENQSGTFVQVDLGLPNMQFTTTAWADFDRDGDEDLLMSGPDANFNAATIIYENRGDTLVNIDTNLVLPGVWYGDADWTDLDGDGWLDFIVTGLDGNFTEITTMYRYDGTTFQPAGQNLVPMTFPWAKFMDFDMDADEDLLLMGVDPAGDNRLIVYRNDNGTLVHHQELDSINSGFSKNPFMWGDLDSDGDPDLVLGGSDDNFTYMNQVYINTNGNFIPLASTGLPLIGGNSSVALYDFDQDNDLDFAFAGYDDQTIDAIAIQIFRNDSSQANTVPTPPAQRMQTVTGNSVTLSWSRGMDAETLPTGLTYNLQLTDVSRSRWIVTPQSLPNGTRLITAKGNLRQDTTVTYANLLPGKYQWQIQSIDNNYASSVFSTIDSFVISNLDPFQLIAPADQQSISILPTSNTIDFNWESVDSALTYRYYLYESGNFTQPLVTTLSASNGSDSTYSLTEQDLYDLCFQAGQVPGTTASYQWLTVATGAYDSVSSIDTFSISITLGSTLETFSLLAPQDQDSILLNPDSANPVIFTWGSASGSTGYTWYLTDSQDAGFLQPIRTFPANSNGSDTTYTIREDSLAQWLTDAGHPGTSGQAYLWRVVAQNHYETSTATADYSVIVEFQQPSSPGTGIGSVEESGAMRVYPVPFRDEVRLSNEEGSIRDIRVINQLGVLVYAREYLEKGQIDLVETAHWSAGIYLLHYKEAGANRVRKLLKY